MAIAGWTSAGASLTPSPILSTQRIDQGRFRRFDAKTDTRPLDEQTAAQDESDVGGRFADLLGVDAQGRLAVIELEQPA